MEIFFEITYKHLTFGFTWNQKDRGLILSEWPNGKKAVRVIQGNCITQKDAEELALACIRAMFNDPISYQLPESVCDEWRI